MAKLLVIHGVNLNMLGKREPEIYGSATLDEINQKLMRCAEQHGHTLAHFQSNAEHALIERVHQALSEDVHFIVINPGAYTHTSIALRDAFLSVSLPFIEVHLSNPFAREHFRRHSYLSDVAAGVIVGLGASGYELAIQSAEHVLAQQRRNQ